jgi:DNA-binding beta-propeller fold protein YncE
VHHFKQSGELIKTIGTGTAGDEPGELHNPWGIAVSRLGGSIYIGEHGNDCNRFNRISEFNQSDGAFVRVLDTPGLGFPDGICLSPDETTLAVAQSSDRIILFSVDGSKARRVIRSAGSGDGQFARAMNVHFTADGEQLVVSDCGSRAQCRLQRAKLQVFGLSDGSFVRKIDVGAQPHSVAVDAVGNIIVTTEKHVKVFSSEGTLLHDRLGGLVIVNAAFGGLAIDPVTGRIAVGDAGAGIVHLL